MKKLNINITKAQLTSFTVALKENRPEVDVTIALLTDGGKVVTDYSIGTEAWRHDSFDLPVEIMPLIGDIARVLEGVAVRHAQAGQLALAAPKPSQSGTIKVDEGDAIIASALQPKIKDDVIIEDIGDEPINLDDIPF